MKVRLDGLSALMRSAIEVGGRRIYVQMTSGADQWDALSEAIHAGSVTLLEGDP